MTTPEVPTRLVATTTLERLRDDVPGDRRIGWAVALGLGLLAFVIRFVGLEHPHAVMFDETYYAKDAWSLLQYGYEGTWAKGEVSNPEILTGSDASLSPNGSFIVHPPVGKWLIALGQAAFGLTPFGWRIMAVVFGSLLVVATTRLARRVSRSTLVGATAGILLTLDGLAFTMSRIALLDIFQATFLVAGVAALVADRDHHRHRLADALASRGLTHLGGTFGPLLWWRPWRWVAGVLFGLATATKWNSLFVIAVFGILTVLWDVGARRLAGASFRSWTALLREGVLAFISIVGTAAVVYIASWAGWLSTSGGWGRDWGARHPDHPWVQAFGEGFASLLHYHQEIFAFHTGDYMREQTHSYDAHPAGWLVMARPTSFYSANEVAPGTQGCPGPGTCVSVITGMGTPLLWWFAAAAVIVAMIWWLAGRDWRFGVPVLGALATYLPWFASADRPVFFFYAITIVPFTCIALALALGLVLGPARSSTRRRGAMIAGLAVGFVAVHFAFLYPILTAEVIPHAHWAARMWIASWI
ncbi:MAG: phospholipid carrier-dependent glycosyltransferase [Propionibacteriaceae bacterium]|nr:phospholipid carrier-dependent glycosyltransferase [Propionibacteriaceae bacterium]